jgi:SsrA-binding protein
MKIIAKNRRAFYDYKIIDKFLAGMVLKGWQVKSIKSGNISLKQSFCYIHQGELFIKDLSIADWPGMGEFEKQTKHNDIKLLLNRSELDKLAQQVKTKGLTIVPLVMGLSNGLVKLEVALAKGQKDYDKRSTKQEKQQKRDIERELKQNKYF